MIAVIRHQQLIDRVGDGLLTAQSGIRQDRSIVPAIHVVLEITTTCIPIEPSPEVHTLLLMLLTGTVQAQRLPGARAAPPIDAWSAHCELDGRHITVSLTSTSGDALENLDMAMKVTDDLGRSVHVKIRPDWYFQTKSSEPIDDVCDTLASRRIGKDILALFIARDGRPEVDHLTLILLNCKTMRVAGMRDDFGEIKPENLDVRQVDADSVDVRIARWDAKLDACNCADAYVKEWFRIRVTNGRWTTTWLRPHG